MDGKQWSQKYSVSVTRVTRLSLWKHSNQKERNWRDSNPGHYDHDCPMTFGNVNECRNLQKLNLAVSGGGRCCWIERSEVKLPVLVGRKAIYLSLFRRRRQQHFMKNLLAIIFVKIFSTLEYWNQPPSCELLAPLISISSSNCFIEIKKNVRMKFFSPKILRIFLREGVVVVGTKNFSIKFCLVLSAGHGTDSIKLFSINGIH